MRTITSRNWVAAFDTKRRMLALGWECSIIEQTPAGTFEFTASKYVHTGFECGAL